MSPATPPTYTDIAHSAAEAGLEIYGAFHAAADDLGSDLGKDVATRGPDLPPNSAKPDGPQPDGTMVLFGTGPGFWAQFETTPEFRDGTADPVDRWSRRTIDALAAAWGAQARYPFTGPPYQPFVAWARASGRCFTSPSQMLVHDRLGMMISFRGALYFAHYIDLPPPPRSTSPCESCTGRPCLTACPVDALVAGGPYGVAACHDHLNTAAGASCLSGGCLARRACPLSARAARPLSQSAHHMRYFHNQ